MPSNIPLALAFEFSYLIKILFGCFPFVGVFVSHVNDLHSVPYIFKGIESWSHVQNGKFEIIVRHTAIIIINYITNFLPTSINDPIVTIKWQFITGNVTE